MTASCWLIPKQPTVYIVLGRLGDICQLLPAFFAIAERTGDKPHVMVSQEYASLLDGVSYVRPWPVPLNWKEGVPDARKLAEEAGYKVVVPAWWNDAPEIAEQLPAATRGTLELRAHGRLWKVDTARWPDYTTSCFDMLGIKRGEIGNLPLIFDRRDREREKQLVVNLHLRNRNPVILYNFTGISSPFLATPEVHNGLMRLQSQFQLVDLGRIRAAKPYDLLGLYDVAAGLITIDTFTLHLAQASTVPYVAYTQDGWRGSTPRGNCIHHFKYIQGLGSVNELTKVVTSGFTPPPVRRSFTIRRTIAIGDVLAATSVARKLKERGARVTFQASPIVQAVLSRSPFVDEVDAPGQFCDINLDGVYERVMPLTRQTFYGIFAEAATKQLGSRITAPITATNCSPKLVVNDLERRVVSERFQAYPRPWIAVSPRSNTWFNRTIPDRLWGQLPPLVKGTLFWLGNHGPAPDGMIATGGRTLDDLIKNISVMDLFVGVDSGPMHIAAALGVQVLGIEQSSSPNHHLSDQQDFEAIPVPGLSCLDCQHRRCPINYNTPPCQQFPIQWLADHIARKLWRLEETVSVVIPTFRAPEDRLNKCIDAVLPQAKEVIVTVAEDGEVPLIHDTSGRVRVVRKLESRIGFGRNVNFGARHSSGKYLLVLNDDVFLDPAAVEILRKEMAAPDVGVVSHFMTYPNGTIYHAGKVRNPGDWGWYHIDSRKRPEQRTFKQPLDLENVCGASMFFRRSTYYQIGGFDEDYLFYAEDDDICMRVRYNGWRVRYTPHATGVHIHGASTKFLGKPQDLCNFASSVWGPKWKAYLEYNRDRIPGNFDYLRK